MSRVGFLVVCLFAAGPKNSRRGLDVRLCSLKLALPHERGVEVFQLEHPQAKQRCWQDMGCGSPLESAPALTCQRMELFTFQAVCKSHLLSLC